MDTSSALSANKIFLLAVLVSVLNLFQQIWEAIRSLFGRRPAPKPEDTQNDDTRDEEAGTPARPSDPAEDDSYNGEPSWLLEARSWDGTRETSGKGANPDILAFFADAGHPEVKSDEVAWCAAFVGACLERKGFASTKQLLARSYLSWGKELRTPRPGCIVVLKRGNSSWEGHVGFFVAQNHSHIWIIGGNQSNAVNVKPFPKSQLLGYRWPSSPKNSRTVKGAALALTGEGMGNVDSLLEPIKSLGIEVKAAASVMPWLKGVGFVLTITGILIVIYARFCDWKTKGR